MITSRAAMAAFRAFRISKDDNVVRGALVDTTLDELSPGEVVIRAAFRA